MKVSWNYDETQYSKEQPQYEIPPEGKYQVRLVKVDYQVSKSGKDMHVLHMEDINGKYKFRYYLVLDAEHAGMTNQNLGRIFDSFKIKESEQEDDQDWLNHWGGVEIVHETFINRQGQDQTTAKVKYLLTQEEQEAQGWALSLDDALDADDSEIEIPF